MEVQPLLPRLIGEEDESIRDRCAVLRWVVFLRPELKYPGNFALANFPGADKMHPYFITNACRLFLYY